MTVVAKVKMLAATGMAIAVCGVATAAPAWSAQGAAPGNAGPRLLPRAGEWWLTTWKMVPRVWPLSEGAGVTVAVLGTGVQASVPDLRGVVLPGGDLTGRHSNAETDFDGSGTMMAVLIAGQGYGTGMIGMAPKAKILPVVVNAGATDGISDPATIAAGIIYAANHGARVIDVAQEYPSASASGCDATEQAAVSYALARDIVVVAAAGDTSLIGGAPAEPASCAGVLAVGALRPNRVLWPEDARQPYITVVNPGAGLISSGRDGHLITGVNGTAAASALAAGAVALIAMLWYQVIQRVTGTALTEGGQVPNDSFGYGIFRLSYAINATAHPVAASAPNPVHARYLAWLASPQGRSVARQDSPPPAKSAMSASPARALIAVAVLLTVVGAAALFARPRRRRGSRGPARRGPNVPSARDEHLPSSDAARADPARGYLPLGEPMSVRIPPYVPAPANPGHEE
jgi:membrane-anchored mycosin MYCP